MIATFVSVAGTVPEGADLLREHLRWTDAERRWQILPTAEGATQPPPMSPPARAALRGGARLHSFTDVRARLTGAATRNHA